MVTFSVGVSNIANTRRIVMDIKLIVVLIIPMVMFYYVYISIITKKNKVKEALSGIDVQLKKRADLIPSILKIAKRFMVHEKSLLTEITELRTKLNTIYDVKDQIAVKEHLEIAQGFANKYGQLMLAVENYPDLKSDSLMSEAQNTLEEIEAQLSAARRFYNAAVNELNNLVELFPINLFHQNLDTP